MVEYILYIYNDTDDIYSFIANKTMHSYHDGILFKRILNMRGNKVYDCAF